MALNCKTMDKPILNFIFQGKENDMVHDGLWAALKLLEKDYQIHYNGKGKADFTLGWGAFGSDVDEYVRCQQGKKGLCIGGNTNPPVSMFDYDVLFYETEWYRDMIADHPNIIRAFGINSDIFKPNKKPKLFDWLGVGAYATWKRWQHMTQREGIRAVIGHYQLNNEDESIEIVKMLLRGGVGVFPSVSSERLAEFYWRAKNVYIPANLIGGGERAIWEAKACGCSVVVEDDNPKLKGLVKEAPKDHVYYYGQLKRGIESCMKE